MTEGEMVAYVTHKVRDGLNKDLQPPTKDSVAADNKRWLAVMEEGMQTRFNLFNHFNILDQIEDQTVEMIIKFRYDPELEVGKFVSVAEQFKYTLPKPLKFLRGRYIVDNKFGKDEKEK